MQPQPESILLNFCQSMFEHQTQPRFDDRHKEIRLDITKEFGLYYTFAQPELQESSL